MLQKLIREYDNTYDNMCNNDNNDNNKRNKGPVFSPLEQHTVQARCPSLG